MSDIPTSNPPPSPAAGIIERAKNIILKPKETWVVIDAEPATTQSIYMPYVLVLAASFIAVGRRGMLAIR